jgi:hypothetical protein
MLALDPCLYTPADPSHSDAIDTVLARDFAVSLKPYQHAAAMWMLGRERREHRPFGVIAMKAGLGKTLVFLVAAQAARLLPPMNNLPTCIIVPPGLVMRWAQEFNPAENKTSLFRRDKPPPSLLVLATSEINKKLPPAMRYDRGYWGKDVADKEALARHLSGHPTDFVLTSSTYALPAPPQFEKQRLLLAAARFGRVGVDEGHAAVTKEAGRRDPPDPALFPDAPSDMGRFLLTATPLTNLDTTAELRRFYAIAFNRRDDTVDRSDFCFVDYGDTTEPLVRAKQTRRPFQLADEHRPWYVSCRSLAKGGGRRQVQRDRDNGICLRPLPLLSSPVDLHRRYLALGLYPPPNDAPGDRASFVFTLSDKLVQRPEGYAGIVAEQQRIRADPAAVQRQVLGTGLWPLLKKDKLALLLEGKSKQQARLDKVAKIVRERLTSTTFLPVRGDEVPRHGIILFSSRGGGDSAWPPMLFAAIQKKCVKKFGQAVVDAFLPLYYTGANDDSSLKVWTAAALLACHRTLTLPQGL